MDGWSGAGQRGHGFHDDDGYGDEDVFGDGGDTRDFLSQPSGFNSQPSAFNGTGYPYHTSSSSNPNRLGMAALDLNSGEGWPGLGSYEGLLRSGTEDTDFGSTQAPPLFRPPPRSGRGTLGLRGGRGGVSRGGATLGRGGSPSLGGGCIPPRGAASGSSGGSRGRGTPLRNNPPPPTFDAEDENSYAQVSDSKDKAHWGSENTNKLCEIYCNQIDNGNCVKGVMSKSGWRDIIERYYAATGLVHDNEQFGNRIRQLRNMWTFIQKLRKGTGLGRRPDGSVIASDDWWKENTQGKPEWKKLKNGWPPYLEEMDRMFLGVAVDGSFAYAPGQGAPSAYNISDDEHEGDEGEEQLTPLSIGTKRASTPSTRSTGSSPNKKTMSPTVRAMDNNTRDFNVIQENRNAMLQTIWKRRQKEAAEKKSAEEVRIEYVQQLARECGATEEDTKLWIGVLKIILSEKAMKFFISTKPEGRLGIIKHYAGEDVEPPEEENGTDEDSDEQSEEDFFNMFLEDDCSGFIYGMYQYAMHLDKFYSRSQSRQPMMTGLDWVERKLTNRNSCYNMFRMTPTVFYRLHDMLVEHYGLKSSRKSTSIEALGMFLWMVGAPQSVRQAEDRFERSLGTVHNMVYKVLNCMLKLAEDIIKPRDPQFSTLHPRLRQRRFYPFFKDCIGAIDGTHVPVVVPNDKFVQHLCRKGMTTQNVMASCDFDMIFTFVLAGWPGSVHDMRVFDDATGKYSHVFSSSTYREVLPGGFGLSKPSRLSGAVQGNKVPSSRVSKRRRTTR